MQGLPAELIYLLVLGAVLLINYAMQRLGKGRQSEVPQEPARQDELARSELPQYEPPRAEPPYEAWGRVPQLRAADPPPAAPSSVTGARPVAVASVPRGEPRVRSLVKGRRNLRDAIVIMAVLGPCRGQEPPPGTAGGNRGTNDALR